MATPIKFGIVVALESELRRLLRRSERIRTTPEFAFYEFPNAAVICGGIGKKAAGRAAQALTETYRPSVLVSAGFAGAAKADLKVGNIFVASEVYDIAAAKHFSAAGGDGILVTVDQIANQEVKMQLARGGVSAVDMEASAVAGVAERAGLRFLAVKAISDEVDFHMPALDRFVGPGGRFHTSHFITYVALRPWLWASMRKLAVNSAHAARALSTALDTLLREGTLGKTQIGDIVRADA